MLGSFKLLTAAALTAASLRTAFAYQVVAGPPCEGRGMCSYSGYTDGGQPIIVTGNCSPSGYCGDAGAACTSDDQCYDYCGTGAPAGQAVCGGLGATCDSQNPYAHNAFAVTCYTPGFVCSADGMAGTCLRAASPGARARARRADTSMNGDMAAEKLAHQRLARNNVKASDLRERAAAAILRRRPTTAGTAAQDPTHVQARAP